MSDAILPDCYLAVICNKAKIKIIGHCQVGSTSTTTPPISVSDIKDYHNNINDITFRATLVTLLHEIILSSTMILKRM